MRGYIVLVIKVPGGGYRAFFPDLPGCRASGRSVEDALANARSALREYAAKVRRHGLALPPPRPSTDVVTEESHYGAIAGACLELRDISLKIAMRRQATAA